MPTLLIGGAVVMGFSESHESAGPVTLIEMKSDVAAALKRHLDIEKLDIPGTVGSIKFNKETSLSASNIILTPNDAEYKQKFTLDLGVDLVSDFAIRRVKDENGNGGVYPQAYFNIRTRHEDACAILEKYMHQGPGRQTAQLKITFSEQTSIPEVDGAAMAETAREAGRKARKEAKDS